MYSFSSLVWLAELASFVSLCAARLNRIMVVDPRPYKARMLAERFSPRSYSSPFDP
jgi:predicted phosphatase